jgi:hypothetical protein
VGFAPGWGRRPAGGGGSAAPTAGRPTVATGADVDASLAALKQADAAANTPAGFGAALADEARYHRPGSLPLVGKPAIVGAPEPRLKAAAWASSAAAQAKALDLGYSYGRYDPPGGAPAGGAAAAMADAGWYVRVWRKNGTGAWQIVAQVDQPDGP